MTARKDFRLAFTRIFILLLVSAVLSIWGCGDNGDSGTGPVDNGNGNGEPDSIGENEVWMVNTAFLPETLTVTMGDTVTWINKDAVDHSVISGQPGNQDGIFASGTIQPGDHYKYIFSSSGTFPYYCGFHPFQMQGTIIVP